MLQIYLKVINEIHLAVILGLSCFLCYPQEKAPDSAPVPTAAPPCHHEVAWCSPSPSRPSNRYRPGISQHSGKTNHSLGPQTSQDTKPCSSSDHGTLMLRVMEDRQEEGRVCDPQEYSRESSISTAARGNFFFFFFWEHNIFYPSAYFCMGFPVSPCFSIPPPLIPSPVMRHPILEIFLWVPRIFSFSEPPAHGGWMGIICSRG